MIGTLHDSNSEVEHNPLYCIANRNELFVERSPGVRFRGTDGLKVAAPASHSGAGYSAADFFHEEAPSENAHHHTGPPDPAAIGTAAQQACTGT